LLLFSILFLTGLVLSVTLRERKIDRATEEAWNKLRVPLPATARIDGLRLPAGTMVRWNREQAGHLLTVDLGSGQEVAPGIVLAGEVDHIYDEIWTGNLTHDSVVRGWNCAAGKIAMHNSGELRWCVLGSRQILAVGEIPKGTAVSLDPSEPSNAVLHLPAVGMRANPGNFWIPPGAWFALYADGELLSVPGPIIRRGVSLGSEDSGVMLRYGDEDLTRWYGLTDETPKAAMRPTGQVTGWRGNLNSSLTCAGGHRLDKGSQVTVPVSGDVITTTHWDSSKPRARPVLDSYHCDLGPPS
jgi:hypothetical protein